MSYKKLLTNHIVVKVAFIAIFIGALSWLTVAQASLARLERLGDRNISLISSNIYAIAAVKTDMISLNNDIKDIKLDIVIIKHDIAELRKNFN